MRLLSGDWGDDKPAAIRHAGGRKYLVIAKGVLGSAEISPAQITALTPHAADDPPRGARRVILELQDGRRGLIACNNKEFDALTALTFQSGGQPAPQPEKRRFPYFSAALLAALIVFGPSICSSLSARDKQVSATGSATPRPAADPAGDYVRSISVKLKSEEDAPTIKLCTEDALSIVACLDNFHAFGKLYEEGADLALTSEQQAVRQAFKQRVSAVQRKLLPAMRDKYGPLAAKAAWIEDVKVRTFGMGFSTIEFTGWQFAANRNIQQTHDEVQPTLSQMRFKRAVYRWVEGGASTYFDLPAPDDGRLAVVDGDELRAAKD